jgi:hypothetical protein
VGGRGAYFHVAYVAYVAEAYKNRHLVKKDVAESTPHGVAIVMRLCQILARS